tara:strand:+ start:77 stop:322 length:246 start_codon:yes stop_codon:yes gene_type:complete
MSAPTIIMMKREYWNAKRNKLMEMRDEKINAGNEQLSVATLNMLIDQAQEIISDLTNMHQEIINHQKHTESIINLITKNLK